MYRVFIYGALALLLLAAGCNKLIEKAAEGATEKAIESASGGKVDVDLSEGGMTMSDEDGSMQITSGDNARLPDGWPAQLPLYPGATLLSGAQSDDNGNTSMSVYFSTPDGSADVAKFYEDKALAAGYTRETSHEQDGMFIRNYAKGGQRLAVQAATEDGSTSGNLTLYGSGELSEEAAGGGEEAGDGNAAGGEGQDGGGSEAADDSGGFNSVGGDDVAVEELPDGFPLKVLKPYPGGRITQAMVDGANSMLMQHTTDSAEKVYEFYNTHFTGRGWAQESEVKAGDMQMYTYASKGGSLNMTITSGSEGQGVNLVFEAASAG